MANAHDSRSERTTGLSYTIDETLVRIVAVGPPGARELDALLHAIAADPGYRRGMPILHDQRGATTPTTDYAHQVAEIMRKHASRLGPCRWAVVVGIDDRGLAYGMSRMISALHDASAIASRPFTSVEEALEWLHSP